MKQVPNYRRRKVGGQMRSAKRGWWQITWSWCQITSISRADKLNAKLQVRLKLEANQGQWWKLVSNYKHQRGWRQITSSNELKGGIKICTNEKGVAITSTDNDAGVKLLTIQGWCGITRSDALDLNWSEELRLRRISERTFWKRWVSGWACIGGWWSLSYCSSWQYSASLDVWREGFRVEPQIERNKSPLSKLPVFILLDIY